MKIKQIDIILPTFHEEDNIAHVIRGIHDYVKTPHLITIVLQDKKDPTIPIIKKLQKKIKNIQTVFTTNGKGMLKALQKGFAVTKNDIIVVMMSDRSDNPRDIDKMFRTITNGSDLVCASRNLQKGKRVGGPKIKHFLSFAASTSLHALIKLPTTDATNAFKCFKRSLLKQITIESTEGFAFPLELTVKIFYLGKKITDIPTVWQDRKMGQSQFNIFNNLQHYLKWYLFALIQRLKHYN